MSRPDTELPVARKFPLPAARVRALRAAPVTGTELGALLGPVRAGNAFEETVERLLTVIKLGVVAPGERFPPERELAGMLGISRITLREAIRALQQAGYVESRRGRFGGTFVLSPMPAPDPAVVRRAAQQDLAGMADALTFRLAVDTGAAQVLALSAGDRGRDVLLARLAAVNTASPADYRRLDTLFHLAIAELTGSSLLAAACADARMRLNDLLNAIPVLRHNIAHTAALQHQAATGCHARIAGSIDRSQVTNSMTLQYLYPESQSWSAGHRSITCLVVDSSNMNTSILLH